MTATADLKTQVEATIMARRGKQYGNEIRFQCPNPAHDDNHNSADYNIVKCVWICRACGESGNYWHLGHLLGLVGNSHRADGYQETRRWDIGGVATHKRLDRAGAKKVVEWERQGKAGLDGLHTADLPLYGVEHISTASPDADILVSEGEKPTDALLAIDFTAVGTVTGAAGTPSVESLRPLAEHQGRVFLCRDNDPAGHKHMERIAARLKRMGKETFLVTWTGVSEKGDAYDYIASGHTADDVRAVLEAAELYQGEATTIKSESKTQGNKQLMYLAKFDGLVDIVDDAGDLAYLIREQNELKIVPSVEIGGYKYLPPPRDQLPYLMPRWNEVKRAYKQDNQTALFKNLIEYHKKFSELPSDGHYVLLPAWDFSNYILEALTYSGYISLYAVPERGKTKTGQAAIYVAYRGIHQTNLREADLFRASEDLGATLFLDVLNLWKRAQREGSEDILLQRYEKGARVRRVLNPERGAFRDSRYYAVYGATIIASNEAISHILESRSFPVDMPYSPKNFPKPTPEMGLPFRERLVAWRAHNLDMKLLEPKELTLGRLNDIATPLWQIIRLVSPSHLSVFEELIKESSEKRREERATTIEGEVIKALLGLQGEAEDKTLPVSVITDKINEKRRENKKASSIFIGKVLRRLNFKPAPSHKDERSYLYDTRLIQRLAYEYGLADTSTPSDYPSQVSQVSPQIQKIVSTGTDRTEGTLISTRGDDLPPEYSHDPCLVCKGTEYWLREASRWGKAEWVCERCHPKPRGGEL